MERLLRTAPALVLLALLLASLASLPLSFGIPRDTLEGAFALTLSGALFLGAVPALVVRFIYKERLADYGARLPLVSRKSLAAFLLAAAAAFLPLPFLLQSPEFRDFYSLSGTPWYAAALFLGPLSLIYYASEEFLFRGVLAFALYRRLGYWMFPVLAALFAALHLGKPPLEAAYAALVSVAFSWLSLSSRSFLPAAFLHFIAALAFALASNYLFPGGGAGFRF
jgi:membrane protease YdiL (CAAX protease family)